MKRTPKSVPAEAKRVRRICSTPSYKTWADGGATRALCARMWDTAVCEASKASGDGSSRPCPPLGCFKRWQSDHTCHHPHNQLATMGSPDWNLSMSDIHLRKLLWVYCPGHAGVKGYDWADRLAAKATLPSGLHLGRSEVFTRLRHYLRAQSQGQHTIDRLEERRGKRKR